MAVNREEVETRVAAFDRACRAAGRKVTHQRSEIFREVAASREHPDAETIFERVRQRVPAISRDTVYRTLAFLEDLGLVSRVDLLSGSARFDANADRHHHFICRRCGRVQDFTSPALDAVEPPPQVNRMGRIEAVQVQVRGVCAECSAKAKQEK